MVLALSLRSCSFLGGIISLCNETSRAAFWVMDSFGPPDRARALSSRVWVRFEAQPRNNSITAIMVTVKSLILVSRQYSNHYSIQTKRSLNEVVLWSQTFFISDEVIAGA